MRTTQNIQYTGGNAMTSVEQIKTQLVFGVILVTILLIVFIICSPGLHLFLKGKTGLGTLYFLTITFIIMLGMGIYTKKIKEFLISYILTILAGIIMLSWATLTLYIIPNHLIKHSILQKLAIEHENQEGLALVIGYTLFLSITIPLNYITTKGETK